jgi:uncharacterized protein YbjQ (UPF0145 family)
MRVHQVFVVLCLGLPACSFTTIEAGPHHAERLHASEAAVDDATASRVRVLQNESFECASEVLGTVDVHEDVKNEAQALGILRRRAAALGAEAVIGVEFHHGEGGGEATHLSGMAVRCKDLIRGRPYDVVGEIDVPGRMGHDDEAFAALRARASALHADLITDIRYEHGEGEGKPPHLSGKAIRFQQGASLGPR